MNFELVFETTEPITPLDTQFGADTPLTVPDGLHALVFGTDPDMTSYALLDAAKVSNLPELLEASGLEHTCLYDGSAADDLAEVAPWLVKLAEGDKFTRHIFSKDASPYSMWDAMPGVVIRTQAPLAALSKHLKRFTQLPNEKDQRVFLRFWEPLPLGDFLNGQSADAPSELAMALFDPKLGKIAFAGWWDDGCFWSATTQTQVPRSSKTLRLTHADKILFTRRHRLAYIEKITAEATKRIEKQSLTYSKEEIDAAANSSAAFVFEDPRPESATVRDGTALLMLLLLLGPDGGKTVLDGPVMRNLDLTLNQRIEITGKSYIVGMKRISKKDVV